MPHALILQHTDLKQCDLSILDQLPLGKPTECRHSLRFPVATDFTLPQSVADQLAQQQIDFAVLPDLAFADLGLIVSDMDSTLITIECVDEIAAGVGLKNQVAEITERSMRGELDFEQSLRQRVALLAGLNENVLQQVYDQVLQLSPGAEFLLAECHAHNVPFMLVSGGFTFFTERLQQQLGFAYQYANILDIQNGKLTGNLLGGIIDAQAKARLLRQHAEQLGIPMERTLAMGDGANDIPMIEAAGFGIAYRAKPKTQSHADACINFGGLERIRYWFR
ncbi:phosphoserine phosphatase SerB [Neisseria sp. ZJ106]|uniref:Phosphoserine phosphatase n=1 Tax=Neisseria lisongii TaxID=2912188 RepID=A0ABY7RKF1_9NEIS|nr:phosphoserine phosphatase SerB [Neisseria lisongii]MCF7521834.1 phosphoserine phosphatase SerB [Neisseria lisongii]WCL71768.1 phosphoserine phosphatase SerB [Neisseria lisongii]